MQCSGQRQETEETDRAWCLTASLSHRSLCIRSRSNARCSDFCTPPTLNTTRLHTDRCTPAGLLPLVSASTAAAQPRHPCPPAPLPIWPCVHPASLLPLAAAHTHSPLVPVERRDTFFRSALKAASILLCSLLRQLARIAASARQSLASSPAASLEALTKHRGLRRESRRPSNDPFRFGLGLKDRGGDRILRRHHQFSRQCKASHKLLSEPSLSAHCIFTPFPAVTAI